MPAKTVNKGVNKVGEGVNAAVMNATHLPVIIDAPIEDSPAHELKQMETAVDFYAHRSGHETWQYCPRRRYLAYHHLGTGVNIFPPIYFEVGTCVHLGLANLMSRSMDVSANMTDEWFEEWSVGASIKMYRDSPIYQRQSPNEQMETETLIAGLLWAFWFRVWPLFNSTYQVLMVERSSVDVVEFDMADAVGRLHILSRPDVLVRQRQTGEIVCINWKTINSITDERRQNIANSLQVNLEAYYGEQLYAKWLAEEFSPDIPAGLKGAALMAFLDEQQRYYNSLPREVAYTQIVYLVKGNRQLLLADGTEVNNEESDDYRDVEKFWRQDSILCYRWVDLGGATKTPPVSWSYRYHKKGNKSYNNLEKTYARQPVWELTTGVKEWVQALNAGNVFPSNIDPYDDRNAKNPLDKLIFFESPIYRDDEMQGRLLASVVEDEMTIAASLMTIKVDVTNGITLDDTLDTHFPMRLISCRKPVRCEFEGRLCNVPKEKREPLFTILPVGSIWYQRIPHHAAELEAFNK